MSSPELWAFRVQRNTPGDDYCLLSSFMASWFSAAVLSTVKLSTSNLADLTHEQILLAGLTIRAGHDLSQFKFGCVLVPEYVREKGTATSPQATSLSRHTCGIMQNGDGTTYRSIRQRIVNMGNNLEVNHVQPQAMNQAMIRRTTIEVESSAGNDEIELLSKDLLHHMMDFFVSESGLVDGNSLRSCALVCKRWKEVAYSPSIWIIPASFSKLERNSTMATNPTTGQGPHCTMASSLAIREMVDPDAPSEFEPPPLPVESLIGFYNLGRLKSPQTSPVSSSSYKKTKTGAKACISFRVMERSTGRRFILSIAKDEHNTPEVVKELFQAHLEQSNDFFSTSQQPRDNTSMRKPFGFPRGVHLRRDGRLIRWYDHTNDSEVDSESHSEDESSGLSQPLQPLGEASSELNFSIGHLLGLEGSSEGHLDPSRGHLRSDCWATLVDWIAEIVVRMAWCCFASTIRFREFTDFCVPPVFVLLALRPRLITPPGVLRPE
jgi:hypothetical protein